MARQTEFHVVGRDGDMEPALRMTSSYYDDIVDDDWYERVPRHQRASEPSRPFLEEVEDWLRDTLDFVRSHAVPLAVIGGVLLTLVMLYGPVRDWYVAMRSRQDLSTYYAALERQNLLLRDDLERLQTRDGIENEARKRGFIAADETGVLVENLELDEVEEPDEVNVSYETTWDVSLLDFVFGYTAGEWR